MYTCVCINIYTHMHICFLHFPDFGNCSITCLCFQKDFLSMKMSILSYHPLFLKIRILVYA